MDDMPRRETLLQFPCEFELKAFGPNDGIFAEAARLAVDGVVAAPMDAVRVRPSAQAAYACVSVVVRLQNFKQLEEAYAALRRVNGLKYLL